MRRLLSTALSAALTVVAVLSPLAGFAQETKPMPLDSVARTRVIEGVLTRLISRYVFPEVATRMEQAIRERLARKEYDSLTDGQALAARLTADLQAISKDRHLRVHYSPEPLPADSGKPMQPSRDEIENHRRQGARENFGFERLEIFPGNIGYLKLNYFVDPEWMGETMTAAFNYLAHTDALIIDLRDNRGSMSEQAIPRFCSYLFEKPTHINSLYWRPFNKTTDYFTSAEVPGKRYLHKPIYLLTSSRTFSGGEEFAYDLQNLKRATLIGETTGGGAHGGGTERVDDHFAVWVPMGRAISPITGTNWEGVGVRPDIAVPAVRALHTARVLALTAERDQATEAGWKSHLDSLLTELKQNAPRLAKATFQLKGHPAAETVHVTGTFNNWSPRATPLTRQADGWKVEVEVEPGRHQYKFIVDGRWITDPANPETARDREFTNSVLTVR